MTKIISLTEVKRRKYSDFLAKMLHLTKEDIEQIRKAAKNPYVPKPLTGVNDN